ncbi:hypothetical protein [Cellulophaga baltica]|uniref:hypothetical protein n=1 Tax=Cellulophaga baltica TaxID=76594 RepID=UPI0003FF1B97|nr:hypothetical protein [Cellulophaga baltica]
MKDKQALKIICEKIEFIIESCDGIGKDHFLKNDILRASLLKEVKVVGRIGMKISSNVKEGYSEFFFWGLFFFMERWDIFEDDNEGLWYLIKGSAYYEFKSLNDHLGDFKIVFNAFLLKTNVGPAQRVKLIEQRVKNDNQQLQHLEKLSCKVSNKKGSGTVKLIYTPMGNKR